MASDTDDGATVSLTVRGDLVEVRLAGDLRLSHLQEVKRELRDHPDVTDSCALLVDLRDARFDNLTGDDLRGFAAMPVVLSSCSRRAFVAPGDFGFAMARMFEILRADESRTVRVFRDYEEASSWAAANDADEQNG